jgi:hypothetical protein
MFTSIQIVAECNSLCHSGFHFATDFEERDVIARIWRGWAAADNADEIAAHLRDGTLARYASAPGNVSADVLQRPLAGGVELMTLSVWDSRGNVPPGVEENHGLLVGRQTIADCWEIAGEAEVVTRAA